MLERVCPTPQRLARLKCFERFCEKQVYDKREKYEKKGSVKYKYNNNKRGDDIKQ